MKRRLLLLLLLTSLLAAAPVLAYTYSASITVTESASNDYAMLPIIASIDNAYLADNGYISLSGLDTRVLLSGSEKLHMLADDKLLFCSDINADESATYQYTFGNTPLSAFPIVIGYDGYVTIPEIYPTVKAVNGGNTDTDSVSHIVNLPTGIVSGDLLLVFFVTDGNPTITFPEGWTQVFVDNYSTAVKFECQYRVATGTEGSTITVTTSSSQMTAHTTYLITNYTGTPEAGTPSTGNSINPDPPSLTPSWGAKNTLWIASCGYDRNRTVTDYPTDYTNGRNDYAGTSSGCGLGTARRNFNVLSEDPGTFTIDNIDEWVAGTVAIQPAEGLELGNNFEIEQKGYIDTSSGSNKDLVYKEDAFRTYVSASGEITSGIVGWATPTGHNDPSSAWDDETNAYDDNTSTYASSSIPANNWGQYLELTIPSILCDRIRFNAYYYSSYFDSIDIDVYYGGSWHGVYEGNWGESQVWVEKDIPGGAQNVTQSRVRIHSTSGVPRTARLYEFDFGSPNLVSVTATGVSSGEHIVKTTADGTNLKIYVDDVEKDSTALGGASVDDNTNSWTIMQNNVMAYMEYMTIDVSGAEKLWYQPIAIISGTTLPDRTGNNDGTITWGSNPTGISVSVAGLESTGVTAGAGADEPTPPQYVSETPSENIFAEGTGEGIPLLYPVFKMVSDQTGWPIQIFWITGALSISMLFGAIALIKLHSMMIAAIISGAILIAPCSMELVPWWVLYVYAATAATFVVYQRVSEA